MYLIKLKKDFGNYGKEGQIKEQSNTFIDYLLKNDAIEILAYLEEYPFRRQDLVATIETNMSIIELSKDRIKRAKTMLKEKYNMEYK